MDLSKKARNPCFNKTITILDRVHVHKHNYLNYILVHYYLFLLSKIIEINIRICMVLMKIKC